MSFMAMFRKFVAFVAPRGKSKGKPVVAPTTTSGGSSGGGVIVSPPPPPPPPPTLAITTTSLASGTEGDAYSRGISATGGVAPRTFAVHSGALPGGLSLSSSGVLSGTPTAAGAYSFTVRVTDAAASPSTDDQAFSVTIAEAAGEEGDVDDLSLAPMVFSKPGFTTFTNIGGWDQTIAQFTANAALMTHVTLSNPDWIEGPGTRMQVLDAVHGLGLKAATAAGRRFGGTSWADATELDEYSWNPGEVIDHAALQGGGILQLPDESDLYWNGGTGSAASSPTAILQIVTDWKAGHSGNLGGLPVYHNLLSASQLYSNYDVNAPFLNDANLFATSADQYPITYFVAQSLLVGLADWSGPQAEFTTGATGMTTWLNKFGPHPSGATGQLGKPHFEALSMCRQADTGHHLTAAEQDVLAWSIIIMGGDGWTQFTTSFITDGDPQGTGRDRWSPSSAGLPGGMKAWMATGIARMALIESKGCLFRDTEHGGGRSWFRIRRSAPATAPGSANAGDRGPPNSEAITWAAPASTLFLPGGWQAIRMWNEAKTQSWYLLQNIVAFGSSRTLTLASGDPWHDALNGKTHGPGEVVFYNSDGTVVSGWPT
jgi:hypothetical protein